MTTQRFLFCMKRTLAFFLIICMIMPFTSCGEENNVSEVSESSSNIQNSNVLADSKNVSESSTVESSINMDDYINFDDIESIPDVIINPKGKYDFTKVPFKNKDGIIDFSDKFPFQKIVNDEPLRQELIKIMKEIGKVFENLYNEELNIVSDKKVEIIDKYNYYCEVLPEIAKNKEELVAYYKKYFAGTYFEPYTSIEEWAEKELFAGDSPIYKTINNSLCFLVSTDFCCCGSSDRYESAIITSKSDNEVEVAFLSESNNTPDYSLVVYHFIRSNDNRWVLEESSGDCYDPTKWYFEYSYINNAPKINLILSGSDSVKIGGKKVFVNNNGVMYELIENFSSVKEMTDYFNEIFTPDIAKKYIGEYISVYYEKDGKLFRKVGAEKAKMPELKTDDYSGYLGWEPDKLTIYSQCTYLFNADKSIDLMLIGHFSDQDYGYMLKLSDLKIAQELPLEKIG